MRSAGEFGLMTALLLWFLASAVAQVRTPRAQSIRRYDRWGLLPTYNFFAPSPGLHDCELRMRDLLADGTLTSWRPLPVGSARRWWHGLFNPTKREKKTLLMAVGLVLRSCGDGPGRQRVTSSPPYRLLLDVVVANADQTAVGTQFCVIHERLGVRREVLHSPVHAIPPEQ